jgi:hypothetical protein
MTRRLPLLVLSLLALRGASVSLVNMDSSCKTAAVQNLLISSLSSVAIEFVANAASGASIQTLSLCLGGVSSFSGTLTVELWNTNAGSPFLPSAIIAGKASATSSVSASSNYAWKTATLTVPIIVPAGSTRYALVFKAGAGSVRWGSPNTATIWSYPVFRQAAPCADPCVFSRPSTTWGASSFTLGFDVGGVVVGVSSPTATVSRTPTPSKTKTVSGTITPTQSQTLAPLTTATASSTPSPTKTPSATLTASPTVVAAASMTGTPSQTQTASPTSTPSRSSSQSRTLSTTVTAAGTPSAALTPSATRTLSTTVTASGTLPLASSSSTGTTSTSPTRTPSTSATPSPPCPAGTYTSDDGTSACLVCEEGFYCPAATTVPFGIACGVGHWCAAGVSAPSPCPPFGTVNPLNGLVSNGPAWDVEKATCEGHCYYIAVPGEDGQASACF